MARKTHDTATQKRAATNDRNLRTFLLLAQFEILEIGRRVREARKKAGLTQEQLAAMCSFSKRSLQDYEAGVTEPYKHLREIAQATDRPLHWLLTGEEPQLDEEVADRLDRIEQVLEVLVARSEPGEEEEPP
jgi:transcriptional regulator with XRE-family HTH domain